MKIPDFIQFVDSKMHHLYLIFPHRTGGGNMTLTSHVKRKDGSSVSYQPQSSTHTLHTSTAQMLTLSPRLATRQSE